MRVGDIQEILNVKMKDCHLKNGIPCTFYFGNSMSVVTQPGRNSYHVHFRGYTGNFYGKKISTGSQIRTI
jgi:hypothetical protein